MFTKKDYRSYFDEIHKLELAMKKEQRKLRELIADPEARAILDGMLLDEARHTKLIIDLKKLI